MSSNDFPLKSSSRYTKLYGIRLEPELKDDLESLKRNSETNVPEAVRIVLRELVKRLKTKCAS